MYFGIVIYNEVPFTKNIVKERSLSSSPNLSPLNIFCDRLLLLVLQILTAVIIIIILQKNGGWRQRDVSRLFVRYCIFFWG